ncbi:MAG: TonB-dependent receptor [Candidatus Acidiferrum sp.]
MSVRILLKSMVLGLFLFIAVAACALAQTSGGAIRGRVTDPSGATVAGAAVLLTPPAGASIDATTNGQGIYTVTGLLPGKYTVKVVADGFALFTKEGVDIRASQTQTLDVPLTIEEQKQKVEVNDSNTNVSVDPENNAGMVVLRGKDLEALSDDPDELQSELQSLAGPSAGPNGGQIYIDGFTGGTLPPKASIREIRINQNPFSAEFDRLGYGRIEIFTKPGTDQFHGQLFLNGNTAGLNARNPFEIVPTGTQPPGYHSTQFSGNVGGPMGKKASFFFNLEQRNIDELSIVNATVVDPTFNQTAFSQGVASPRTRINLSPRFDYQVSKNNTLTARYQLERENENNNGVGQFNLPSVGFHQVNTEHQIQISDTQILSPRTINETRFRFVREGSVQTPNSDGVTISVPGAFTNGGSNNGNVNTTLFQYEFQNYTSMSLGKHFLKFGVRIRDNRLVSVSTSNYNGTFQFAGITPYQITVQGLAQGMSLSAIRAAGGGADQYTITAGSPSAEVNFLDGSLHLQDDWRVRPNITLSAGLRYETQNNIADHADFAPRVGFAWGIGGGAKNAQPKVVLRGGFGIFYDRFGYNLILQQQRLNGLTQQSYTFAKPNFYLDGSGQAPPLSVLLATQPTAAIAPTIYRPNPNLRTPYTIQSGLTLERQLTKNMNLAVTYLTSRGVHQFFTENINPPICSALPCDPKTNPHVLGTSSNIYQYQSEGIFKQNQLIVNSSVRMGTNLSLFGYYTLNYASGDTAGAGSFPSMNNDISLDYGRSPFDVRHRLFLGGTVGLPFAFRLSPFVVASSGSPYNITTGQDLNGDSRYNDRPAFATPSSPPQYVVTKPVGSFDLVPQPGETIVPINSLTGTEMFSLNLRLSKTFGFGKRTERPTQGREGGPGPGGTFGRGPRGPRGGGFGGPGRGEGGGASNSRYNLTFGISARNLFNNVNLATPTGNLSSPFFGRANSLAGFGSATSNRRVDLQVSFSF